MGNALQSGVMKLICNDGISRDLQVKIVTYEQSLSG